VPLTTVTTLPLTVQTEAVVVVMVGVTPLFCVVATVNVEKYGAVAGAPVKVTVGGIRTAGAAVTASTTCAAAA